MSGGWSVTTGETLGRLSDSHRVVCLEDGGVATGETLGRLSDSHRVVCLEDGVSLHVRH